MKIYENVVLGVLFVLDLLIKFEIKIMYVNCFFFQSCNVVFSVLNTALLAPSNVADRELLHSYSTPLNSNLTSVISSLLLDEITSVLSLYNITRNKN